MKWKKWNEKNEHEVEWIWVEIYMIRTEVEIQYVWGGMCIRWNEHKVEWAWCRTGIIKMRWRRQWDAVKGRGHSGIEGKSGSE